MAVPWGQSAYGWTPSPSYYSPGYWQYVPVPYPIYPPTFAPPPGQQFQGEPVQRQRPPTIRHELLLHRFLGGQRRPTAVWDISQPPLKARRLTSHDSLEPVTRHFLDQPATNPSIRKMRIVFDSSRWDVNIHIPPRDRNLVVSIGLVLDAIHGTLSQPLTPEEWSETCPTDRRKIYKKMLDRLMHSPPSMRAKGCVWRIDTLLDKTQFLGLRPGGPSPDEWILLLGPTRRAD